MEQQSLVCNLGPGSWVWSTILFLFIFYILKKKYVFILQLDPFGPSDQSEPGPSCQNERQIEK